MTAEVRHPELVEGSVQASAPAYRRNAPRDYDPGLELMKRLINFIAYFPFRRPKNPVNSVASP